MKKLFILAITLILTVSCNIDNTITGELPPEITLDNNTGVYRVKQGRSITISPKYSYVEQAQFCWSSGDEILSTLPSLTFCQDEIGEFFITLTVTTEAGVDKADIKIEVVELEIPWISLPNSENGFTIAADSQLKLIPTVKECSIETLYSWYLDGEKVSEEIAYTFSSEATGRFSTKFIAENEDGADSVCFEIIVCNKDELPISWSFGQNVYNYSSGRRIKIAPTEIINGENGLFSWYIDGELMQQDNTPYYICSISEVGSYQLTACLTHPNGTYTLTEELTINVAPVEGTFYRGKSASSNCKANKIYDYTPAPGQFINDVKTSGFSGNEISMEDAIEYAEGRLEEELWLSLGGFGGYIVARFDHSIDCTGGYDLAISANSFDGDSEPGVVWVMQDENGDGEPNDTWYELKGSETAVAGTIQDYAITYYRPVHSGMDVQWTDNQGGSGTIDYLIQYHDQDSYYPSWITEDKYTLRGTRLEARNYDSSGNGSIWVLPYYDWGYVDNNSPIDLIVDLNTFKISNAIDFEGNAMELKYIDFVKIQTGVNGKSGWVGEISTEVSGIYDYKLMQ